MRDVFRTPHAWATPLFGGMAARGGAGETGGSQEDSDAEGDPAFDLMDTNAKRKEIKRRTKDANLPPAGQRAAGMPRARGASQTREMPCQLVLHGLLQLQL